MLTKVRGPTHLRFSFPDGFRGERERGVRERSFLEDELDVFLSGLLEARGRCGQFAIKWSVAPHWKQRFRGPGLADDWECCPEYPRDDEGL